MKGLIRNLAIVTVLLVAGYLLTLHAGMSSDQDDVLAWYYKIEFVVAGILCWPIWLYLQALKMVTSGVVNVGVEAIFIHYIGYLLAFKAYEKIRKHNK